jgi:uncharacterized membrane-anchored protein YhcB (DUF1043 family)
MIPLSELWEVKLLGLAIGIAIIYFCFIINNKIEKEQNKDDNFPDVDAVDDDIFS